MTETQHHTRRKLLTSSLSVGSTLLAGCLEGPIGGQDPQANHWAAGIQWSASQEEVAEERGFLSEYGNINHASSIHDYLRVNGGELRRMSSSSSKGNLALPASRGDHIEYYVDLDSPSDMRKKVFEYTIPDDDDLIAAVVGFAECLLYEGADEWVARPYNADVGKNIFRRPEETLLISVITDESWETINRYIWGHTSSIREYFRELEENSEREIDTEFVSADEPVSLKPVDYQNLSMAIYDGSESIAHMGDLTTFPKENSDISTGFRKQAFRLSQISDLLNT